MSCPWMSWHRRRARYSAFTARLQPPQPTPALLFRGPWLPPPVSKDVGQQPARAAPLLHLHAQKHGSAWERLFEPLTDPLLKAVLCCVQVTQLVQFLVEHQQELLGEEVAGLASQGDEEPPAPPAEPETAEVCEVHTEHDNKSLPLSRWDCCCCRDKHGQPPACSSAKVQSKADAGWPSRFVR